MLYAQFLLMYTQNANIQWNKKHFFYHQTASAAIYEIWQITNLPEH